MNDNEEKMEKIFEKISSYNILNFILPGIVYGFLCKNVLGFSMPTGGFFESIFLYYAIGMVISRIGSTIIEPIFVKLKIIRRADYADYIKAGSKDAKLEVLLEMNNSFRTFISLILVFGITALINEFLYYHSSYNYLVIAIALVIVFFVFVLSYRKQTSFIKARVETIARKNNSHGKNKTKRKNKTDD